MTKTNCVLTLDRAMYHRDEVGIDAPCLSSSIASILLRDSPQHAYVAHPKLGGVPREDSETFDLGTAAHDYILEGTEDRYAIIDAEDWRTKAAKEARTRAREDGRTPLLRRHVESVRAMSQAVRSQLAAFEDAPMPLADGHPEQTLVWQDGGVWCKARLDWLSTDRRTIDDLKTGAVSARPEAWTRTLYGAGRDLQAAFYLRGLKAITGHDATFRFVVAENAYPYAVSVIALSPEALAHADAKVQRAIEAWGRCLHYDSWPGYPTRTCYVDPPAWALAQELDASEAAS